MRCSTTAAPYSRCAILWQERLTRRVLAIAHHGHYRGKVSDQRFVLLADDDDGFRATMRGILEHHGYAVLEASDGRDALDQWKRHGARIGLVVSDVRMPALSGPEFVAHIRADMGDMPVVFMSGITSEGERAQVQRIPGARATLLRKPFDADALTDVVARYWPAA